MLLNVITRACAHTIWGHYFNNHMDKILTIYDPLPPLGGQIWTFLPPFSYVQVEICQPLLLFCPRGY